MKKNTSKTRAKRQEHDFYETPSWCVDALVENIMLPHGTWLEPAAGNGSIIKRVSALGCQNRWVACELQPKFKPALEQVAEQVFIGDFFEAVLPKDFAACVMNPPYSLAESFVKKALTHTETVCALLRLGFLSSKKRQAWMSQNRPDVVVLCNRPSFTGTGTDKTDYGWFVWRPEAKGQIIFARDFPLAQRRPSVGEL
jgi:hypothetical protein